MNYRNTIKIRSNSISFSGCENQQSSIASEDSSDLPNPVYPGCGPTHSVGLRGEHALNFVKVSFVLESCRSFKKRSLIINIGISSTKS